MHIIPQWDTNPHLVAQATTLSGKLALLGIFGLLLYLGTSIWWWTLAILAGTSLLPSWRRNFIVVGTLGTVVLAGSAKFPGLLASARGWVPYVTALGSVLLFGVLLFKAAVQWPRSRVMKRPVLTLNIVFASLAGAVAIVPLPAGLRSGVQLGVLVLAGYLWFFAYSLQDRLAQDRDGIVRQIGSWSPFWINAVGAGVPLCKGAAYLRKIEATTPQELAVTQLKGLKLLMWCMVLKLSLALLRAAVFGSSWGLGVPELESIIQSSHYPAPYLCWASLIAGFADAMLSMAVWGHFIVACCRMAGFRALRNTYRPLEATSIADFWNRYYYYFKELLVDFFFYPTYLRYFKRRRKLRMFAATLAAATVGNMIYHFFRDVDFVWALGPWKAIAGFRVYAVYTLLLGCGIGISQLRGPTNRIRGGFIRTRVLPSAGVIGFFCLIHVFDYCGRDHSITQHVNFLLRLVNM
jgi:hypothetical protein